MLTTKEIYLKLTRVCPKCGHYSTYKILDSNRLRCRNCNNRFSGRKIATKLKVLEYFALEVSARKTSQQLGISYNTVKAIFNTARDRIYEANQIEFKQLFGELEADETYFGGKRKGIRGRSPINKEIVFGIIKRNISLLQSESNCNIGVEKVFTITVPNCKADTLLGILRDKTILGSVYYTDEFRSYKDLDKFGEHKTIKHSSEYVDPSNPKTHTNGIEGFWSFTKERLKKFHGINHRYFLYYLKEYEWRFNHRQENIFQLILEVYFPFYKKPKM
jgi:transposase